MNIFETLREEVSIGRLVEAGNDSKAHCVSSDHPDNRPSMHVYDDHVHCYSCGFHGDVVTVWAAQHGFDRPFEAALDLAREFGIELPEQSPEAKEKVRKRREKEERYLQQARERHQALERHPRVREWWESRSFSEELQERFLLGCNENGTAAIMPFWHRGRVQGLIRRNLEGEPKYLYPSTEEFPAGYRPLFVPGPVRAGALLVEGIPDAMAAEALGESAAAVGGTGISEEQRRELERFPGPLYILSDDDEEGSRAARKWVRDLYPKALLCPPDYGEGCKDLADFYQERGDEARDVLEDLKQRAVDALELEVSEAEEKVSNGGQSLDAYRRVKERILPLLLRLKDEGERDAALRDVARRLKLTLGPLRKALAAQEEADVESEAEEEPPDTGVEVPQEQVEELVGRPGVLEWYVEDVAKIHGVVGEREHLKLITLNAAGAQLAPLPNGRPVGANVILTAEAGRGKNYLADAVAGGLPEEFFTAFESASAKSLFYKAEKDPGVLRHVWIYPNEAEATDQLVEMFRPLISGGRASHITVNKDAEGRNAAQEFRVEGPVSLTIPTIRNKLDAQLQTRMLVSELPDYEGRVAAHSRAFSKLLLPDYAGEDHTPKIRAWQAAWRGLTEIRKVVFPLAHEGFCFDSDTVSHGSRLWGNLLGLMLAHAWLEQRNRETLELPGGELAIVATPEDYEAAYKVFRATCERSVVNLSDTHRAILDAVYELKDKDDLAEGFSHRKIAERAGVHHSTVGEHRTFLVKSVKLLKETESGMLDLVADAEPSWWHTDDLLEGFPRPEQVWRWRKEKESQSSTEAARHIRHLGHEDSNPLISAEKGGGRAIRHRPTVTRHLENGAAKEAVAGTETAVADELPATEKPIVKPDSNGHGAVAGVAVGFGGEAEKVPANGYKEHQLSYVVDGLRELLESNPESREYEPQQLSRDLYLFCDFDREPPVELVIEAFKEVMV